MAAQALQPLRIARRFHGPPQSGNGGYVAGLLAQAIGGPAEITLRAPVPLEVPLQLHADAGGLALRHGASLIAQANPIAPLALELPYQPNWDEAVGASAQGGSPAQSEFGDCFVCGRRRHPGEGLCVWAEHRPARQGRPATALAAWQPHPAFARADGLIAPEFLWGALDCPGAVAVLAEDDPRTILTGRLAGQVDGLPRVGERCIVLGWSLGGEGRKFHSGTAVIGADGKVLAQARATWIVLKD